MMKVVTMLVLASALAVAAAAFVAVRSPSQSAASRPLMAYRQAYQYKLDQVTGHVDPVSKEPVNGAAPNGEAPNGAAPLFANDAVGSLPLVGKSKCAPGVDCSAPGDKVAKNSSEKKMESLVFDNFVMKRVLSVGEALSLIERILLCPTEETIRREFKSEGSSHVVETVVSIHEPIVTDSEGHFSVDGKHYQLGKVSGPLGMKDLWKGNPGIKIEQDQYGTRSVKFWFQKTGLEPRYSVHSKKVIRDMFARELEL